MEGFVKSTLGLKRDVRFVHRNKFNLEANESTKRLTKEKISKLRGSETISSSSKQINNTSQSKSNNFIKNVKTGDEDEEESHPTLRRRYARLFITVPKKSGYGYKLRYKEKKPEVVKYGHPSLLYQPSDLQSQTKIMNQDSQKTMDLQSKRGDEQPESPLDIKKIQDEWLPKSVFSEKGIMLCCFVNY